MAYFLFYKRWYIYKKVKGYDISRSKLIKQKGVITQF